jgi:ankyrin repeat protein
MRIIHPIIKESWEIEEEFSQACINNDFKKVHQLLTSKDEFIRKIVYQQNAYNNPLIDCIKHGNLKMLKYLTTSPKLDKHFDLNQDINCLFEQACHSGHTHIIDYLLNTPEIKSFATYNGWCSAGTNISITNHSLDMLKYFRRLPNRNQTQEQIEAENGYIIDVACEANRLDIIQYIFDEPRIENYKDKINNFESVFERAIKKQHLEIVKFFILDLNIEKTDTLKQTIRSNLPIEARDEIENCFNIREVNKSLHNDLPINDNSLNSKKLKV